MIKIFGGGGGGGAGVVTPSNPLFQDVLERSLNSWIYTTVFDMSFFDTMFWPRWYKSMFSLGRVKKITSSSSNICIIWKKRNANFWHRIKTIHRPSVNRFDGVILWYDFDYKKQSGNRRQTKSIIEPTRNDLHTDDAKNWHHVNSWTVQKITSCRKFQCEFS